MCSLLIARCAVVHQTSCSEASSEPDHCEVNVITDQHCDPLNLPELLAFHSVKWLFFADSYSVLVIFRLRSPLPVTKF